MPVAAKLVQVAGAAAFATRKRVALPIHAPAVALIKCRGGTSRLAFAKAAEFVAGADIAAGATVVRIGLEFHARLSAAGWQQRAARALTAAIHAKLNRCAGSVAAAAMIWVLPQVDAQSVAGVGCTPPALVFAATFDAEIASCARDAAGPAVVTIDQRIAASVGARQEGGCRADGHLGVVGLAIVAAALEADAIGTTFGLPTGRQEKAGRQEAGAQEVFHFRRSDQSSSGGGASDREVVRSGWGTSRLRPRYRMVLRSSSLGWVWL